LIPPILPLPAAAEPFSKVLDPKEQSLK